MRRLLKIILGLFLLFMLVIGALFASVFIDKSPVQDGQILNGHGVTVDDGYSSAFLLQASDGQFALVDCTNDAEATVLKQALKARGAGPESVKAILLTHGHPDHIAGCKQFPQADVYGFSEDARMAKGEEASRSPMGRLAGAQTSKTVTITKPLTDGQEILVGDLTIRAFAVPGHTDGSAAYLARGVLYLGDSAKVNKDGTVSNAPWLFTHDVEKNAASVAALATRLQGEDVKIIAFSHTGPLQSLDRLRTLK